jgi:hypothetical protein
VTSNADVSFARHYLMGTDMVTSRRYYDSMIVIATGQFSLIVTVKYVCVATVFVVVDKGQLLDIVTVQYGTGKR